jgi:hypothetical protein
MKKKILCFDLDNVVCFTGKRKNYAKSKPNYKTIKLINELYDKKKYIIKIYTARGMSKFNGNKKKVISTYKKLTIDQLKKWKVRYDILVLCKTSYDIFVDDKAFGFKNTWQRDFKKEYL